MQAAQHELITSSPNPAAASSLGRRWGALDRDAKVASIGLGALLAGAVGVRAWFMLGYPTPFFGFPDSGLYMYHAEEHIFSDPEHPAGYAFFLRLLHLFSDSLSFVVVVQHLLGIATGLLLYKAVRRTGAPPWLGLLPAMIVFFGGTGLLLEHAVLADPLLAFLQALALYLAIRSLYEPALRWPLLAGLTIGVSFWDKTVATSMAILLPIILLCAAPGARRRRLLSAVLATGAAAAMIFLYVAVQYAVTGYLGYESQGAWNPYEKVAMFVDCTKFRPPPGTAFLCPREPPGHRQTPGFYQYDPRSPAVSHLGVPYEAPAYANGLIKTFTVAAIEHEPVAYVAAVVRGLSFYVFPRHGEGSTPQSIGGELVEPAHAHFILRAVRHRYPGTSSYSSIKEVHSLLEYDKYTHVEGAFLIVLLLAAIAGPFFLRSRLRWAAAMFTLTALCSITFVVAGASYDARYAYPTFGPLAAGAALGAWGIASIVRKRSHRRGNP